MNRRGFTSLARVLTDLDDVYSGGRSWSDLRSDAGLPTPNEEALRRAPALHPPHAPKGEALMRRAIAVTLVLLLLSPAALAADQGQGPKLTVMTQNLYVGFDGLTLITAL